MNIDKHTLALVGYPVNHSLSPLFQNEAIQRLNLDFCYHALSIEPNQFSIEFPKLLTKEIGGMNITMPYKNTVLPYLHKISTSSALTGSVNTIYRLNNRYYGTSTDGIGFFNSLFYKFPFFSPTTITILGCGGAARSILAASKAYPIKEIIVFQRKNEHWNDCSTFIKNLNSQLSLSTSIILIPWEDQHSLELALKKSSLLINCTNIGFTDFKSPLENPQFLHRKLHVYDIIYKTNNNETTLIQQARSAGCTVQTGLGMLLFQGAESFRLFTGQKMPIQYLTTLNPNQL